ncbi:MAG: DNA alkylation repair protein [Bacteroidota bacterium]
MQTKLTAKEFLAQLKPLQVSAGIRMAELFALAKSFTQMPIQEVEKLLDSKSYDARMGAVCIMDFQARDKKIPAERKKQLFDLYITKHNKIDTWDMVDRSAPYVVGGYLFDKPRDILYKLAKSKDVWERRTAIVSTYFFIRQNDIDDTFKIAKLLVKDKHEMIHSAVGSWIREAGKRDQQKLLDFLDTYSAVMPRTMLRYAVEKLDKRLKDVYMMAAKGKP